MLQPIFESLKRFTQFTPSDEQNLKSLYPVLRDKLHEVVAVFYERLSSDPAAAALLSGPERIESLKRTLHRWLVSLLSGPFDQAYVAGRGDIGRRHVEIDMPPHLMFAAMNVVRHQLDRLIGDSGVADPDAKRASLNKLLDIELALMSETFRDDYVDKIQRAERLEMENRLKESQQLATVGQLAASLAHEIKNPLAGISGAIQVIRETLRPDDPHREVIDEILGQINRLDSAVKDLLVYSRPTPPTLRPQRLGDLIQRAITLLRDEPAIRGMQFALSGDEDLKVDVDENQFQQVIMNLLINAAHACDGDGRIEARFERHVRYVRLAISDNGRGMSESVRQRAFEPFFTTKAKGTGLGLSICEKVVAAHHGRIEIESQLGRGTTVRIELPLSAKRAQRA